MSLPLRFTFPMPVNLANGRHHWRALHRRRKAYYLLLDELQLTRVLPPPPSQAFQKAVLHTTLYLGAAMDDDNASARTKWCVDWLKTRGYITDDRKANLLRDGYPRQVVRRDGNYRVEIVLTELQPPSPPSRKSSSSEPPDRAALSSQPMSEQHLNLSTVAPPETPTP